MELTDNIKEAKFITHSGKLHVFEKIKVKNIDKTFEYIDLELIQYLDAADNMQTEYVENKILPDFIKLCNPEWNERIEENKAFIKGIKISR